MSESLMVWSGALKVQLLCFAVSDGRSECARMLLLLRLETGRFYYVLRGGREEMSE